MSAGDCFDGWPPKHGPNGSAVVSIVDESIRRDAAEHPNEPENINHRLKVLCADGSRAEASGDGKTAGKWIGMSAATLKSQMEARSYVLAKERKRNWGQPEFGERFDALVDVLEERLK